MDGFPWRKKITHIGMWYFVYATQPMHGCKYAILHWCLCQFIVIHISSEIDCKSDYVQNRIRAFDLLMLKHAMWTGGCPSRLILFHSAATHCIFFDEHHQFGISIMPTKKIEQKLKPRPTENWASLLLELKSNRELEQIEMVCLFTMAFFQCID